MPDAARAPSRIAAAFARWRRIEPRVGVIVILAGLATGLWLGADGDAGVHAIARALAPSFEPSDEDVAMLRRADELACDGPGTEAERAAAALAYLERHSPDPEGHRVALEAVFHRSAALSKIAGRDAATAGAHCPRIAALRRQVSWWSASPGRFRAREVGIDDLLVTAAPPGLLDRAHPSRRLATGYTAELATRRGIGPVCVALVRAGLSPAEAFVAARATGRLGEPRPGCDARWFRTAWKDIADELCSIATDTARDAGERHAAIDALAWIADLPPCMVPASDVPVGPRSAATARTWKRLRDLDFLAGARKRVSVALAHAAGRSHVAGVNPAASLWWLESRLDVPMNTLRRTFEEGAPLDALRAGDLESALANRLSSPPGASPEALLAAAFDTAYDDPLAGVLDVDARGSVQWLLAMRLDAAGGVAPSGAREAYRSHAEWRAALGLPPLRARVTVDRFELTADGVAVQTEVQVVPIEHVDSGGPAGPEARVAGVLDTAVSGTVGVPGVAGDAYVWRRALQWMTARWQDQWDDPVFGQSRSWFDPLSGSIAVTGDRDDARVAVVSTCSSSWDDGPLRWSLIFSECAAELEPAATWEERLARALEQSREDWTSTGFEHSPPAWRERLDAVALAAASAPAPTAREEIAALLDARQMTWADDVLRNLVRGLALSGDHELLLRPADRAEARLGGWETLAALPATVPPSGWLALLAETDDLALRVLALRWLSAGYPDPQISRVLLEIVDRRGIELAPSRRELFAARAKDAPPRDIVELIAQHVEPSYALLGALHLGLLTLLLALIGRRRRRTVGGGTRCAASTVVLGLVFVVVDWSVGPLDVVPDSIGYLFAAHGCSELSRSAKSRIGRLAAVAFGVAAIGDLVDQVTVLRLGITPAVDLVAMVGVVALAGLGRDMVRATTPPVDAVPRRPVRIRPVVWLTPFLGALLAFVATAKIREELSFDLALEDAAYLVAVMVLGVGAVLALGRRHAVPVADAALSPLPLPFVLSYALPVALLAGYALTTDTGATIPQLLYAQDVGLLTMISTSLAVVWVLLRLLDVAGIATSRRGGAAGTGGGPGNSPAD